MFRRVCRNIRNFKPRRALKLFWQKKTRGWSDEDTWSLDFTIAKFVYPRLKRFKELHCCHPIQLTEQEWNLILDKMIAAFEILSDDFKCNMYGSNPEEVEIVNDGLEMFAKWYSDLWW